MSAETLQQSAPSQEVLNPAHDSYFKGLDEIAARLPEIENDRNLIENAAGTLLSEFGIHPELFQDKTSVLIFTAISQRFGQLEASRDGMDVGSYTKEKEFIADAVILLAGNKSDHYNETRDLIDIESYNEDKTDKKEVFDKYTNKEVTQELAEAIRRDGLLDGVKERLGITKDNEDPYDLRVLNIGGDVTVTHGMMPTIDDELNAKDSQDPAWDEYFNDSDAYKAWELGLNSKGIDFKDQIGMEGDIPVAWVTTVDGKKTLNIPLPFVEKILYKDEKRSNHYTEDDRERDLAILEHEYTHTQGGYLIDNEIFYGIAEEERRAEYFSGDKHGYQDVKGLFMDVAMVSGVSIGELFESQPKGGTSDDLHFKLADKIGLQRMFELAIWPPSAYVGGTRPLQKNISEYFGSPDFITKRIYDQRVADGNLDQVNSSIETAAERLAKMDTDFWASYRRNHLGLKFVTDKLVERIEAIRQRDMTKAA